MKRYIYKTTLIVCCILSPFQLLAQNGKIVVTGQVCMRDLVGIGNATVSAIQNDSIVVTNHTDKSGFFRLTIPATQQKLMIKFSAVGFENFVQKINVQIGELKIPVVILQQSVHQLADLTISSRKPILERTADRMIFNVASAASTAGKNAFEILRQIPSVTVNFKDQISVNGRKGVQLTIDDKPAQNTKSDLPELLKTIRSEDIEKIEVISAPSAKYDAAGIGGIINIVLKKSKEKGSVLRINSSVEQGKYNTSKISGVLDHNYGNWSFYISPNYENNNQYDHIEEYKERVTQKQSETLFQKNWDNTFSLRGGLEYRTRKNIMSLTLRIRHLNEIIKQDNKNLVDVFSSEDSLLRSNNRTDNKLDVYSGNLYHSLKIDTLGNEKLVTLLNFSKYINDSESYNVTRYTSANDLQLKPNDLSLIKLPFTISLKSGKADYTKQWKNGLKVDLGIKISYVNSDNNSIFSNGFGVNEKLSNHFLYQENINAAYLVTQYELNSKWDIQAGLRAENTRTTSLLSSSFQNSTNKRNYTDFFPSILTSYQFSTNAQYSGSFSRRISRPDYADLNPFVFQVNPYYYLQGNPLLKPEYISIIELGGLFFQHYNLSVSTSHISNVFNDVPNVNNNATILKKENLDSKYIMNISASAILKPADFWEMNHSINILKTSYSYSNKNIVVQNKATSINYSLINSFKISKSTRLELSGTYNSPTVDGISKIKSIYWIYASGQYKAGKNQRFTFSLSLDDVLKSYQERSFSNFDGQQITTKSTRDSRRVIFSCAYNLKTRKSKQSKKYENSSKEEEERIK